MTTAPYTAVMRTRAITLLTLVCGVLAACAGAGPASEGGGRGVSETSAAVVVRTTVPQLRNEGDWRAKHRKIVAEAERGGHQVVFLGASIIEQWTTAGEQEWSAEWLTRQAVNCGIGGDRTEHVLGRLDDGLLRALAAENNDVRWIVINIGSNNLEPNTPEELAAGIEAIVAKLRKGLPTAEIVLSLVLPRGQWPGVLREKATAANVLVAKWVAEREPERVRLMDLWPKFVTTDGEIPVELMPDFLHPSGAGYKIWSEELLRVIP